MTSSSSRPTILLSIATRGSTSGNQMLYRNGPVSFGETWSCGGWPLLRGRSWRWSSASAAAWRRSRPLGCAGAMSRWRGPPNERGAADAGRDGSDGAVGVYRRLRSRRNAVLFGIDRRSRHRGWADVARLMPHERRRPGSTADLIASSGFSMPTPGSVLLSLASLSVQMAQTRDVGWTGAVIDGRRRPERHHRSLMRLEVVCSLSPFSF